MLSWEHRWRSICQGKPGVASSLMRGLLWTLSSGYRTGVSLRNLAYNQGLFPAQRPQNCMIVSIGNLVAGGTGKTPLTIKLAKELSAYAKVAVLSRGYKSAAEHNAQSTLIRPGDYAGDEPTLIAHRLPEVLVFAGKNRRLSAQMAVEAGAEILLLDDGLQHRQLARDLEIVMIDGEDPFGCGYYLPRGFLRESPRALKRADLVVVNRPRQSTEWLRSFTAAPVVGLEICPSGCFDLNGTEIAVQGKKVGLFCGIAKPEKFRNTVQALGGTVVAERFFPDHGFLPEETVQAFAAHCATLGADFILCTEKDRIKLDPKLSTLLPVVWVRVDAEIISNSDAWTQFLQLLSAKRNQPTVSDPIKG